MAQWLFEAARRGDASMVARLLDESPGQLDARAEPYGWTLLHLAADGGHLAVVDLLLERGLDANSRERGDNTYAMHWAAAAGHVDVVRRLADAGGDVVGRGDDHALEVIGWATCFDRCHDDVAELLVSRGARHHIFSAIAMKAYATSADVDRPVMEALFSMTTAELTSAERGRRRPRGGALDLVAALALGVWETAERLAREPAPGPLHLMAKRGDSAAARWLLAHGADPNARWSHWDADVTPLHLAAAHGHADVVRLLLDAGADRSIRDSKHGGNALDWAEHFQRPATVRELVRS